MSTAPKLWKTIVEDIVREAKLIPLWGEPPSLDWHSLNELLKRTLNAPDFEVKTGQIDWVTPGAWATGLGSQPVVLALEATPLKGHCFWVTSAEELCETSTTLLISKGHLPAPVKNIPLDFLKGFYRFLALQALDALSQIHSFPGIRFTLSSAQEVPLTLMLGIDVSLFCNSLKSSAKLLVSSEMLSSFRQFFRIEGRPSLDKALASSIDVSLSVVIGKSRLNRGTWKGLHVGDFLILDRCSYDPKTRQGQAHLLLEGKSIATCTIDKTTLQVFNEHFHEEKLMTIEDDYPEEDFSSYELPPEDDESFSEENYEEDFIEDDSSAEATETNLESPPIEKEPLQAPVETPSLTQEIPITLSVEVTRLRMGLDKVLALQPGNIIDLSVSAEQGVTLMTGGKAIARGELIQIGDALGVKILELG
ncbi:MAG: type III secretion system cytoplasmic ring protein SctQ [Simkania sp.]|nr:type III secretion system cytoplasmic ring protein SctQ [Simkania sp.]